MITSDRNEGQTYLKLHEASAISCVTVEEISHTVYQLDDGSLVFEEDGPEGYELTTLTGSKKIGAA